MSSQRGRSIISAWAMKNRYYGGHMALVRRELSAPEEGHNPFLDWWMADVVVGTAHTKSLSDTLAHTPQAELQLGPIFS